ncbi:MAG: hypothetical protein Q9M32_04445 [Sulfurimonas sp.]|nr:hypothetical protein [Sulfurimonas sp.]MDQ7061937.1 hypothetical protein [Sulfurimonas sp.]
MLKNSIYRGCLSILLLITSLYANEYEDWLKSQNTEYLSYKKTIDEEFTNTLKEEWAAFESMHEQSPYKVKKPLVLPKVEKSIFIPKKELILSPKVKIIQKKSIIRATLVTKKENSTEYKDLKSLTFSFYSNPINIYYDSDIESFSSEANSKNIAKFWESISKTKYKSLLKQIKITSKKLNLNGWAQYQFIYQLSKTIYKNNNLSNMMTWFFLTKLNYDTKVAYGNNKIYLLSRVNHRLFQVSFYMIDKKKYYAMFPSGKANNLGQIYTYKATYPQSTKALSFLMPSEVIFDKNIEKKVLKFKYYSKEYRVDTSYSKDLIDFYSTFPQSDFDVYFNAANSTYLWDSILESLSQHIENMSELKAANFLLRFTQKAFKYKTDPDQFGYEKPMFPEEMLYYPYSDCEDRAFMFSYLIKNLLDLDLVGVKYSDHVATAIAFKSKVSGSSFEYKNKKYIIADPTYINANVGVPMKQYKNAQFIIIE